MLTNHTNQIEIVGRDSNTVASKNSMTLNGCSKKSSKKQIGRLSSALKSGKFTHVLPFLMIKASLKIELLKVFG